MTTVYFDTETTGTSPLRHRLIQIAAAAVDDDFEVIDTFEVKIHFNQREADAEALKVNSFDPEVWTREAVQERQALLDFAKFLSLHATVRKISKKTGRPYFVAQLAGHNVQTFDLPFIQAAFKRAGLFLPAGFLALDTLQLALWTFASKGGPQNHKLPTLAEYFSVELGESAHDALADVLANVQVARCLLNDRVESRGFSTPCPAEVGGSPSAGQGGFFEDSAS